MWAYIYVILLFLDLCIINKAPNNPPIRKIVAELEGNSGTTTYPFAMPLRVRSAVCPVF
jgi:hypothetical protein